MKKEYILLFLLIFFMFMSKVDASSKYISLGCKECSTKCYIVSGSYDKSITSEKNGYSTINIPSGYNIYSSDGSKVSSSKIYYKTESNELLFGCKNEDKNNNQTTDKKDSPTEDFSSSKNSIEVPELAGEKKCEDIIGKNGQVLIKAGIIALRIITPILLFTLSTYEFMKVIPSKDEEGLQKAWKRFGTRCAITVIIMLIPTLLNLISDLTGVFDSCGIW